MTDNELLAEYVSSGSQQAFGGMIRRHADRIYSPCLRILGQAPAAEDATQAVLLVLM